MMITIMILTIIIKVACMPRLLHKLEIERTGEGRGGTEE